MVEVISSLEKDGRTIPYDIRMGIWVTVEAETEYIKIVLKNIKHILTPAGVTLRSISVGT
jgi:hypothetical protein